MSGTGGGFLFAHFTGETEDGEQVYFAASRDGLNWHDLNGGKPALRSGIGEKGARDPFILKSEIDGMYRVIATDLRIAGGKGWESAQYRGSRSIVIWESPDLVCWSQARLAEVGIPDAGCVWAPEAVYDRDEGNYLVFWASMVREPGEAEAKQRIYGSRTRDFREFGTPVKYLEKSSHVIDTTIVSDGGIFYRISKNESTKTIEVDRGTTLEGKDFEPVPSPFLDALEGVEGPIAFRFPDGRTWCLLVDRFATDGGYVPLVSRDLASGRFEPLPSSSYDMGENKKRHGSILPLSDEEYAAVAGKTP
jgi:hypothetical protein